MLNKTNKLRSVKSENKKSFLDKLETISKIIAAILIPIVIGYMANEVNKANKQKDVEVKLIELATTILNKEIPQPQSKDNEKLRQWGVDVINEFSKVKLDPVVMQALTTSVSLPTTKIDDNYSTWGIVFGGDKSVAEAEFELNRVKKIGLDATVFLRSGSYRSVVLFESKQDADSNLEKIKQIRESSYIVNMEKWCPTVTIDKNIKQCIIN